MAKRHTDPVLAHRGQHYEVDTARLYSVPGVPPPIYVSGFWEKSARLAARIPVKELGRLGTRTAEVAGASP